MSIRVTWLSKGHITHGYRRAFTITKDETLIHVVVFVPMPYESVYQIQQEAGSGHMADPALWWGLSLIVKLVSDRVLLADSDTPGDDGYLQMRPPLLTASELLPLEIYNSATQQGYLDLVQLGGLSDGSNQRNQ